MIFHELSIPGAFEIEIELKRDERGFFGRTWCHREFEEHGLNPSLAQCSISFNEKRGTLRGVHYQDEPHGEEKVVRCTQGGIFDVVLDLRPHSSAFRQWFGVELTAANRKMLYVPKGCGHGFITLEDRTEVFYQMSEFYYSELARGVRWNDPAFQIKWPADPIVMSERDRTYADFR